MSGARSPSSGATTATTKGLSPFSRSVTSHQRHLGSYSLETITPRNRDVIVREQHRTEVTINTPIRPCKVDAYLTLVDDQEIASDLDELLFYEAVCGCDGCLTVPVPHETLEQAYELGAA